MLWRRVLGLEEGRREKAIRNREENDSDDVWENPDG